MRRIVPIVVLLLIAAAAPLLAAQEIVTVQTRPGVTLRLLVRTPDGPPKGTFLLFPGGNGAGHFTERGSAILTSANFLVRSASLFVEQGFVIAVVDVPSDQADGMSDRFRTSTQHTLDVSKALDALRERRPGPAFLVGTSSGTISTAHLGASLEPDRVAGLVLTASLGASRSGPLRRSLWDVPLERIRVPVLMVHHRNDGCWASTFDDALRLRDRLARTTRTQFVEVLGGPPPRSDPCEALAQHGFLGKEREAVAAIALWAQGQPVPERIGP